MWHMPFRFPSDPGKNCFPLTALQLPGYTYPLFPGLCCQSASRHSCRCSHAARQASSSVYYNFHCPAQPSPEHHSAEAIVLWWACIRPYCNIEVLIMPYFSSWYCVLKSFVENLREISLSVQCLYYTKSELFSKERRLNFMTSS